MEWIAFLSLIVSIITLGYALYVGKRQRMLDNQMLKLNEDQLKENIERNEQKKKALVKAMAIEDDRRWAIVIQNFGYSTARNVLITSEDIESDKERIILMYDAKPYRMLHSGESFKIPLMLANGHNEEPVITLIWDDDFGMKQRRDQVLSLVF